MTRDCYLTAEPRDIVALDFERCPVWHVIHRCSGGVGEQATMETGLRSDGLVRIRL